MPKLLRKHLVRVSKIRVEKKTASYRKTKNPTYLRNKHTGKYHKIMKKNKKAFYVSKKGQSSIKL